MFYYLLKELRDPTTFFIHMWQSICHPHIYISRLREKRPEERSGEIWSTVIGGAAAATAVTQALAYQLDVNLAFTISNHKILLLWTVLALFLHFGIVTSRITKRSYSWTLDLFAVSFALSLFFLAIWWAFFYGIYLVLAENNSFLKCLDQSNITTTFDCLKPLFSIPTKDEKLLNNFFRVQILFWAAVLGTPIVILASLTHLVVIIKTGYNTSYIRSVLSVVSALVITLCFLTLYETVTSPTEMRDSLITSGIPIATLEEEEQLIANYLGFYDEKNLDLRSICILSKDLVNEMNKEELIRESARTQGGVNNSKSSSVSDNDDDPFIQECLLELEKEKEKFVLALRNRYSERQSAGFFLKLTNRILIYLGASTYPQRDGLYPGYISLLKLPAVLPTVSSDESNKK